MKALFFSLFFSLLKLQKETAQNLLDSLLEREGRSISVEIYASDIFATVGEFEKHLCEGCGASLSEDVRPQAVRVIEEVDVGVEPFMSFGAFVRVVSEID